LRHRGHFRYGEAAPRYQNFGRASHGKPMDREGTAMGRRPKSRAHGEGTIYQRGKVWYGELTTGWDDNGKRIKHRFKGDTKRAVADQIAAVKTDINRGTYVPDNNSPLAEFVDFWLPIAKGKLRATTYNIRVSSLNAHVLPAFGTTALSKLTKIKIQKWINELAKTRKPNTIKNIHQTILSVLGDAVEMELLARNPASRVILPKPVKRRYVVLDQHQAIQLFEAARGDPFEALYILALTTAMREGELFGLHWSDIDWEHQRLSVCRNLAQVTEGIEEFNPKTASSIRSIPLTKFALDALRRHKTLQTSRKLRKGKLWEDTEYIFTNTFGRPMRRQNLLVHHFRPMLERAGLPMIPFHNLRHSTATLLLSMGVHPKVVQEILGHSSIKMTMDIYSHVMPTISRDAISQLDAVFSDQKMTAE
jgi:integrase